MGAGAAAKPAVEDAADNAISADAISILLYFAHQWKGMTPTLRMEAYHAVVARYGEGSAIAGRMVQELSIRR